MKAYVITITSMPRSVNSANKTIDTGKRIGKVDVEVFEATTPETSTQHYQDHGIPMKGFGEKWSREDRCAAAFMSHFRLWRKCLELKQPIIILEHDAVFLDQAPVNTPFDRVMNIGKPSYGRYNDPLFLGVNPLFSKRYFPGAHAYMINPKGAIALIEAAKMQPQPTDIFLNLDRFPWLQEYYPWPVEVHDTFTTIQNVNGCKAKHNFNARYEII